MALFPFVTFGWPSCIYSVMVFGVGFVFFELVIFLTLPHNKKVFYLQLLTDLIAFDLIGCELFHGVVTMRPSTMGTLGCSTEYVDSQSSNQNQNRNLIPFFQVTGLSKMFWLRLEFISRLLSF